MSVIDETVRSLLGAHHVAAGQRIERGNETDRCRSLGLAVLLLITEFRTLMQDRDRVSAQIEASIQALRRSAPDHWPAPWLRVESYPLRLANYILVEDGDSLNDPDTYELLDFHQSSVRADAMEPIWFCCGAVPTDLVLPRLLCNVAGTLGHVERAMAVAVRCCGSAEAFLAAAAAFEPEPRFEAQFRGRIQQTQREAHLIDDLLGPHHAAEAAVRRVILEHAMRLTTTARAPSQGTLPFGMS